MKCLLKSIFVTLIFVSPYAFAGDKSIAAKDLPPEPTKATVAEIVSTVNDPTKPVILSKPELAIDDAMSMPQKNMIVDKEGEYSTESFNAGKVMEKQIAEKKLLSAKKKTVTVKKSAESHKKFERKRQRSYTKYRKQQAVEKDAVSAVDNNIMR